MFDSSGAETSDPALAAKYVWTVSIYYLRPSIATKKIITPKFLSYSGTQSFSNITVKAHGPVITGSFTLNIAQYPISYGASINLRYSINSWEL